MAKYVCSGAVLKCSMGTALSNLTVSHIRTVYLTNNPMGNISDHQSMINIAPFGLCRSLANPAVAAATSANFGVLTPMPCQPCTVTPWFVGKQNVILKGQPALLTTDHLACAYAGIIDIVDSGQKGVGILQEGAEGVEMKSIGECSLKSCTMKTKVFDIESGKQKEINCDLIKLKEKRDVNNQQEHHSNNTEVTTCVESLKEDNDIESSPNNNLVLNASCVFEDYVCYMIACEKGVSADLSFDIAGDCKCKEHANYTYSYYKSLKQPKIIEQKQKNDKNVTFYYYNLDRWSCWKYICLPNVNDCVASIETLSCLSGVQFFDFFVYPDIAYEFKFKIKPEIKGNLFKLDTYTKIIKDLGSIFQFESSLGVKYDDESKKNEFSICYKREKEGEEQSQAINKFDINYKEEVNNVEYRVSINPLELVNKIKELNTVVKVLDALGKAADCIKMISKISDIDINKLIENSKKKIHEDRYKLVLDESEISVGLKWGYSIDNYCFNIGRFYEAFFNFKFKLDCKIDLLDVFLNGLTYGKAKWIYNAIALCRGILGEDKEIQGNDSAVNIYLVPDIYFYLNIKFQTEEKDSLLYNTLSKNIQETKAKIKIETKIPFGVVIGAKIKGKFLFMEGKASIEGGGVSGIQEIDLFEFGRGKGLHAKIDIKFNGLVVYYKAKGEINLVKTKRIGIKAKYPDDKANNEDITNQNTNSSDKKKKTLIKEMEIWTFDQVFFNNESNKDGK